MITNRGKTEWFKTKSGVRQGSVLSPTLFNIIMSEICLEIKKITLILVYADEVMFWTNNAKELKENLNRLNKGNEFGIRTNFEKTTLGSFVIVMFYKL